MIYSLAGVMQVGLGATAMAASPVHIDDSQRFVQLDNRQHDSDRQREHDERLRQENERHEKEMQRRDHESEREWHERQERENQRHENELHDIAAFLLGAAIGSASN